MTKLKIILFITSIILFQSCVDRTEIVESKSLEIKVLICDKISDSKNVPEDIVNIITPMVTKNCDSMAFIGYDGNLHFIRVGIDNTSKAIDVKANEHWWNFHLFGEPSIDKKTEDIKRYFSDIKLPEELLSTNTLNNVDIIFNVKKYVAENRESKAFIYSKDLTESNYEGVEVYNNIDSLKNAMAQIACKSGIQKFIIIYKIPIPQIDGGTQEPPPASEADSIRLALLNIAQTTDPEKRRELAKKYFSDSFTEQVSVKMYRENKNSEPELWDYNDGKNYILKRLTSEESIKDLKILKVERSVSNNKISFLELIEIHNQ